MKSLKIKRAAVDNRKHLIYAETVKGTFSLPFGKLSRKISPENPIETIFSDSELGNVALTYILKDGSEDSIPIDAFLDHNQDPDYFIALELHKLTVEALKAFKKNSLAKREICRRLETSMSQLQRLFDPSNTNKSVDQMMRLIYVLGCRVHIEVKAAA